MQNTEGAPTAPQDEQEPVSLKLAESPIGAAHTIKGALEQHKLSSWGFVLFRCTYGSQEKWDKFVARVQKYARDEFEEAGLMDVYARMRWTVFEDEAALDGADILETTNRFVKWVDRGPGGQELVGSVFGTTMNTNATARHSFFFHVDEESLENVLDDTKVVKAWWMPGGPVCTMVRADNVLNNIVARDWEKGGFCFVEGRELDEEDMWDLVKRVRIDGLVALYAQFSLSPDLWYSLTWSDDDTFSP